MCLRASTGSCGLYIYMRVKKNSEICQLVFFAEGKGDSIFARVCVFDSLSVGPVDNFDSAPFKMAATAEQPQQA